MTNPTEDTMHLHIYPDEVNTYAFASDRDLTKFLLRNAGLTLLAVTARRRAIKKLPEPIRGVVNVALLTYELHESARNSRRIALVIHERGGKEFTDRMMPELFTEYALKAATLRDKAKKFAGTVAEVVADVLDKNLPDTPTEPEPPRFNMESMGFYERPAGGTPWTPPRG